MSLSVPYTCKACGETNYIAPYPHEAEPVKVGGTFTITGGCKTPNCREISVIKIRKIDNRNFEPVTNAPPKPQPTDRQLSNYGVTPKGTVEKRSTPNLFEKPYENRP